MKVCEVCECEIDTKDGDNRCQACENPTETKRKAANAKRRERAKLNREAMAILGLKRVRGALGGVYYE